MYCAIYLCSIFFVIAGKPVKDPVHPDYVPSIFPHRPDSSAKAVSSLKRFRRHQDRHLERPAKRHCSRQLEFIQEEVSEVTPAETLPEVSLTDIDGPPSLITEAEDPDSESDILSRLYREADALRSERDEYKEKAEMLEEKLAGVRLSVAAVKGNDDKCLFYTGLKYEVFEGLFQYVAPFVTGKTKDSLPFEDQFFITLVKLRLDVPFELLAYQTGCGETTVKEYFWKWIDVLYAKLSFLIKWPDHESMRDCLPPEFREKFPHLTGIIDCFEIKVESAADLKARAQMYSNYKKATTVKVLICCSVLGAVTFLSDAWGGRVSDVELVRESGFISPTLHHPGDQILADRGFTLQDDFATLCSAELIIPAFTKGKSQLSAKEVETSRVMSAIRIHVERVIGLMKNRYTILQGTLPINFIKSRKDEALEAEEASIDRILRVCGALVNLGDSIVFKG